MIPLLLWKKKEKKLTIQVPLSVQEHAQTFLANLQPIDIPLKRSVDFNDLAISIVDANHIAHTDDEFKRIVILAHDLIRMGYCAGFYDGIFENRPRPAVIGVIERVNL